MKLASLVLAAAVPATAAQVPSREALRASPPVVAVPTPWTIAPDHLRHARQRLLRWVPGEVRCGGATYPATAVRRPWNELSWAAATPPAATLRFRVAADGRTLGIAREGVGGAGDDLAPSLAATGLPAGAARTDCRITYQPALDELDAAAVPELASYAINPTRGSLPRPAYDRVYATGTCTQAPRPAPRLLAYPDFDTVPGEPGVRDWVMLGYDLDTRGRPVAAQVLTGTGNAALDAAALTALGRARYTGGPRTGCRYAFWKRPRTLAAPPAPEKEAFRGPGAACAARRGWGRRPMLTFPAAWGRRGIEGWAIIGFDVAPWGETGNVRVLAAEPAAEFGERAAAIIRTATVAAPGSGLTGCVERVVFKLGPDGDEPGERPPPSVRVD